MTSHGRPDRKLTFNVPYKGYSDREMAIIEEALLSDKHGFGRFPAPFEYEVVFEGRR